MDMNATVGDHDDHIQSRGEVLIEHLVVLLGVGGLGPLFEDISGPAKQAQPGKGITNAY